MMALSGASLPMKSSIFSEMANTTTIRMINAMEKKKVPRNFRMMYRSSSFICQSSYTKSPYCFSDLSEVFKCYGVKVLKSCSQFRYHPILPLFECPGDDLVTGFAYQ